MLYIPFPFKQCSKCQKWQLNTSAFFRNRKGRRLLNAQCRKCERAYDHSYYKEHAEKQRQDSRRYRLDHQAETSAYNYRYYRRDHVPRPKQTEAARKEKKRLKAKRYNERHPERNRIRTKRWVRANPGKHLEHSHIRRARKLSLPASFSENDWSIALKYWQGRCAYCGCGPSLFDIHWLLHQEHYIPITPNYELRIENPGYVPTNILPACQTCNHSKHNTNPGVWVTQRFGKRRGKSILRAIETYFDWVRSKQS